MKWFKFYGAEFLSDPKMIALTAAEKSCWVTLLCLASVNDNGVITHITEERLKVISGLNPTEDDWDKTNGMLEKFKSLDMIQNDNEMITITHWDKRQNSSLTGYERVKKWREKKRNDNALITHRVDKNRIDKKRVDIGEVKTSQKKYTYLKESKEVTYSAEGKSIIKAFESVDPKNKTYYNNKTQRAACDFLVSEYGLSTVLDAIRVIPQINQKKLYIGQVTTPFELKQNWVKISNALVKLKDDNKKYNEPNFVL